MKFTLSLALTSSFFTPLVGMYASAVIVERDVQRRVAHVRQEVRPAAYQNQEVEYDFQRRDSDHKIAYEYLQQRGAQAEVSHQVSADDMVLNLVHLPRNLDPRHVQVIVNYGNPWTLALTRRPAAINWPFPLDFRVSDEVEARALLQQQLNRSHAMNPEADENDFKYTYYPEANKNAAAEKPAVDQLHEQPLNFNNQLENEEGIANQDNQTIQQERLPAAELPLHMQPIAAQPEPQPLANPMLAVQLPAGPLPAEPEIDPQSPRMQDPQQQDNTAIAHYQNIEEPANRDNHPADAERAGEQGAQEQIINQQNEEIPRALHINPLNLQPAVVIEPQPIIELPIALIQERPAARRNQVPQANAREWPGYRAAEQGPPPQRPKDSAVPLAFYKQLGCELLGALFVGLIMSGETKKINPKDPASAISGERRILYAPMALACGAILSKTYPQRTWDLRTMGYWAVGILAGMFLPRVFEGKEDQETRMPLYGMNSW